MSKTRNLSDLLDANGDVKSDALDNVPASDVVNDTTPQLGGNLDAQTYNITNTGEVYVGKSTDAFADEGVVLSDIQSNAFTRNDANVIAVRRNNSDGDIIQIRKDSTFVGRIGSAFSSAYYTGSNSGMRFGNNGFPTNGSGANNDNAVDLGISSVRWKDFYLAGNIYLGGTGSANALDDYEEGTWTPRLNRDTSLSSVAYSRQTGVYTKIGQTVVAWFDMIVTSYSGGGGDYGLHGLPFTSNLGSSNGGYGIPSIRAATLMPTDFKIYGNSSYHNTNTDHFYFRNYNSSGTEVASSPNGSGRVSGFTIYTTSS